MKSSLTIHCGYFCVTILAFVAGSYLAKTGSESGMTSPPAGSRIVAEPLADSEPVVSRGYDASSRSVETLVTPPSTSTDANREPLSNAQLEEVVLASLRSRNPLERRRAFDRILREVGSNHFTAERSMAIRRTMFQNGASSGQWKLFDYAWGANAPSDAIALIGDIPEQFREGYIGNILPGLASSEPGTAIELFASLDPDLQSRLRPRLYEGLIDNDIAVATEHIFESSNPKALDWRPMDIMTREIVKDKGLTPTLEWVQTLPEGSLRGNAWSAAYAHWGATEPHAAVQSIIELPESGDRNQAINGFISAHARQDPGAAVIWAGEITQPGMREEAMVRAGKQFFQQDPQAATQWFSDSGLPQERWQQVTTR